MIIWILYSEWKVVFYFYLKIKPLPVDFHHVTRAVNKKISIKILGERQNCFNIRYIYEKPEHFASNKSLIKVLTRK